MTAVFSWVDLASFLVSTAALVVTIGIYLLGRRLSFQQQRERVRDLEGNAWKVLGPIRTQGLNSKIIVMNVDRYARGYDGSNKMTRRGYAYTGPELIEIMHSGVEVIIGAVESYYGADGRRTLNETDRPAPPVIESGHIPWKWIEGIAPEGDEFDGAAIFFVRHRAPGRQPYDYVAYLRALRCHSARTTATITSRSPNLGQGIRIASGTGGASLSLCGTTGRGRRVSLVALRNESGAT